MNILHISPNFNYSCGVSKYVFTLLKYLNSRQGYNAYFITNGGDALSKLKKHNINYTIMPFSNGWENIYYILYNVHKLKSFCIENKIDIIHTHHRYPELLSTIVAKKLNVKTITTILSFTERYKNLSFKSDKIIAVSNTIKNYIIRNYQIPEWKIKTFYNCISFPGNQDFIEKENMQNKLNIKANEFIILFLGRLNNIKGIDILIGAFRKIKIDYNNAKLILVGSILDKTIYKMNIELNEDVVVLPSQEEVSLYYKSCNVFVLPSRKEPFPFVMLEAGLYKKPFIGSRTDGIAEFIDDGVNGFLFEPGNADDLADKIRFVINNPEKAKSAAEELHKKVKKYCNCEEYFEKLTYIYNELLNK